MILRVDHHLGSKSDSNVMAIIKSQGLKLLDMNNGPKKKIKKEEKRVVEQKLLMRT